MKTIALITLLMHLIIQCPEKNVSAINFTITGFDVTSATCESQDKIFDYHRVNQKECHFILYGGNRVLTNDDKINISGYQTLREIKIKNVFASNPEAESVAIYNRYKRI